MRKLIGWGLLIALALIVIVTATGNDKKPSTTTAATETRPGAASVYRKIETSTSCADLQEMFDTAAANNDRETPGTRLFHVTLDYMTVAHDRLEQLGCYS